MSFLSMAPSLTFFDFEPSDLNLISLAFSRRLASFFSSSATLMPFRFSFVLFFAILLFVSSADNSDFYWQFTAGFAQSFSGDLFIHAVNFENNSSRKNVKAVALWITLSLSHAHFSRLGGVRSVRKNTNPVFASFG